MVLLKSSVALFILLSFSIYPQTPVSKGVYSLYGSLTYSETSSREIFSQDGERRYNINPGFDYFFIDNISLGLAVNYNTFAFHNWVEYTLNAGPTIKYFYNAGTMLPFVGASYNYNIISKLAPRLGITTPGYLRAYKNMFSIFGGLEFFLNRNISLEPKVTYTLCTQTVEINGSKFGNDKNLEIFAIGIGVGVFIF